MRGFSLVELILVVGLIAVASAISAPALVSFLAQSYFTTGVEKIVHTLRTAQSYSVSGREDSSWGVHFETGKLVLFKGTDYAARDSSFDAETPLPSSLAVTGWSDVYFDRLRGLPSGTLTLVVEALGRAGTVSLNSEGTVDRP